MTIDKEKSETNQLIDMYEQRVKCMTILDGLLSLMYALWWAKTHRLRCHDYLTFVAAGASHKDARAMSKETTRHL